MAFISHLGISSLSVLPCSIFGHRFVVGAAIALKAKPLTVISSDNLVMYTEQNRVNTQDIEQERCFASDA